MRLIFLDIDGVLNAAGGRYDGEPVIVHECVQRLNRVLDATKARVVISSSWRHIVHGRQMSEVGFEYLLWSHGLKCKVWGVTCKDNEAQGRGKQIAAWLAENDPVESYVVIDDDSHDFRECGHPFVKTDGTKGISEQDADLTIKLLT